MAPVAATQPATGGKSPSAFRTIAEVAADLELPAHVLRFWESRFPQIRPLKRRGGRRYYRPEDVDLLRRIRCLLYTDGYTIKGVQRLLRESSQKRTSVGSEDGEADSDRPQQDLFEDEDAEVGSPDHEAGDVTLHAAPSEDKSPEVPGRENLRDLLNELQALRELLQAAGR